MSSIRRYEEDRLIDRNNLHIELERTPDLIGHWRKEYGKAKALVDGFIEKLQVLKAEARSDLDIEIAGIERELRENWDELFNVKLTEKALSTELVLTEGYKKARKTYTKKIEELSEQLIKLVESKEVLYGACCSMENRTPILHDEVKLYLNGYYGSKPKVPQALEEQTNRGTSREIKRKLQRTKQ